MASVLRLRRAQIAFNSPHDGLRCRATAKRRGADMIPALAAAAQRRDVETSSAPALRVRKLSSRCRVGQRVGCAARSRTANAIDSVSTAGAAACMSRPMKSASSLRRLRRHCSPAAPRERPAAPSARSSCAPRKRMAFRDSRRPSASEVSGSISRSDAHLGARQLGDHEIEFAVPQAAEQRLVKPSEDLDLEPRALGQGARTSAAADGASATTGPRRS